MAPELASNLVAIRHKFRGSSPGSQKRDPSSAMASFRAFQRAHECVSYNEGIDVYSFGITMHEMMVHAQPWHDVASSQDVLEAVAKGRRPWDRQDDGDAGAQWAAPSGWCGLMQRCCAQDPTQRPAFTAVLEELAPMMAREEQAAVAVKLDEARWPGRHLSFTGGGRQLAGEPLLPRRSTVV